VRLPPPSDVIIPPDLLPPASRLLPPQEIMQPQEMRPLSGRMDRIPMFNSNSPEVVQQEGILLSTFPPEGMQSPSAHLNYAFQGRFDLFTHHISRVRAPGDPSSLFQGLVVYNPSNFPVTLDILQAASYLTRPDALFLELPPYVEDEIGRVHAGPGSRVTNDILRGRRQGVWPPKIVIPPQQSHLLLNLPIPVGDKPNDDSPASNARSTLMRLQSDGPLYIANLAMYALRSPDGRERPPTLEEWQTFLVNSNLVTPRDQVPTPLDVRTGISKTPVNRFTYGRVAGVSLGSLWEAVLTDKPEVDYLSIPRRGHAFSYGLSTLYRGRLNTGQIQTSPMAVRYPDTAYQAHGNYGIKYNLTLPLYNFSSQTQRVTLAIQTPVKEDKTKGGMVFYDPPDDRVFFRGTVRLRSTNDRDGTQTKFVHIVQKRGQQGEPLLILTMPPGSRTTVNVDFVYPPDSTPPQILTVATLEQSDR
ncbi:MAG: DUF3370 domain-containing protein, partial [Leptolyngbyaceae bacterium]|nr:DUF3370 domain-containing protein [Leptolyngbyaceae bacterium]